MSKPIAATDDTFKAEVLESQTPVLVDFWAPWCGPCQQLAPVLDELAETLAPVKVVKVNIDENPETPTSYGVRSIPTMMIFKGGELADAKVGVLPKVQIIDWVKSKS